MATPIHKKAQFSIYRFNLIPLDPNNFQPDFLSYKTLDALLNDKSKIFSEIVSDLANLTKDDAIHAIHMRKVREHQYLFLLEATRSKTVEIDLHNKRIPHHPTIWVAIDTSPDVQVIAIQQRKTFSQQDKTPINTITKSVSKHLKEKYLKINIFPINQPNSFWEYVRENRDTISSVEFELSAPNLPHISKSIGEELKELGKSSNSPTTKIGMRAPSGQPLKLDETNKRLSSLVNSVELGGGRSAFTLTGSSKKLYPNEKQITFDAPPESDVLESIDGNESILTKIRKKLKLRS